MLQKLRPVLRSQRRGPLPHGSLRCCIKRGRRRCARLHAYAHLLEEILYDLQLRFVQVAKGQAPKGAAGR